MSELKKKLLAMGVETVPVSALAPPQLPPLDAQIASLLPRLSQFDDGELIDLAVQAQRLETCAFRLRGACAAELRRRADRLPGGRGRRDTAGVGIKAQLAQLATKIGVSVSTLKTDVRIHELFFADDTGPACEPTLPRDYYVTALGAPDPLAAIQAARERSSDPNYNREQFRRDVQALRSPSTSPAELLLPGMPTLPPMVTRVRILPRAQPALGALVGRGGRTPAEVVAAALLAYHEAQTAPKTKRRRSAATPTRRLVQQSLPLSQ
jgi:hypothetical protein